MANLRQNAGYIMLCEAIKKKNRMLAELLIQNNVDVNIPNAKNNTPLHRAIIQFEDLHIMKMLLDRGANLHAKNRRNLKPLEVAIQNNKTKATILLIRKGALVGEDLNALLLKAVENYNYTVFKKLIDHGMQRNQSINFDILFKAAISRGHLQIIEQIIHYWPFPKPSERCIPRNFVIKPQYKYCVELLLKRNFTVSPNSNQDKDFVYAAVENGYLQIVLQLLKLGINVNLVNSKTGLNLLKIACLNKHLEIVEHLLQHNASINVTTPINTEILKRRYYYDMCKNNCSMSSIYGNDTLWGLTCLHIAVLNSDPIMTRLLLKYGAKIIDDPKFFNIACIAVKINCKEIVRIFLDHNVDVNAVDHQGESLLYFCVDKESIAPDSRYNIAELLLNRGATIHIQTPGNSIFFKAVKNRHRRIAQLFLENNANIQYISAEGDTPLHKAIENNYNVEFIKTLLKLNAPVDAVNNKMYTPLVVACKTQLNNRLNIIKALLHHNANVNYTINSTNKGKTPLHFVCKHHCDMTESIIKLLLARGAKIEAVDARGWTPLFEACYSNNDVAVKCLLDHNANANRTDFENLTPLFIAAQDYRRNVEVVKLLLEHKVNVHCMDKKGNSIGHIISQNHRAELIENFVHTQVNFNSVNKEGDTPLHIAVKRGWVGVAENLIKYGANVNILDKKNRTPLRNAMRSYDKMLIKILKIQVIKLKSAGLKVNKQNLKIINNSNDYAVSSNESSDDEDLEETDCEREIEKMRMENIGVNDMTLYDLLKKNVHALSRYVKNKKIQQTLKLEVYDEKFPLYIDIVRSKFRDAKLRYRLMNSARQYFSTNIDQRLSDDCIDAVFSYLNLKEIKMFIRAMKPLNE